jgi:hypothetical protein
VTYGQKCKSSFHATDVIGDTDIAPAGNVVLRIGQLLDDGDAWTQTGHVVLTPEEWGEFVVEVYRKLSRQKVSS